MTFFMKSIIPLALLGLSLRRWMPSSPFCPGCWFASNSGSIHLRFSGCTDRIQLLIEVKYFLITTTPWLSKAEASTKMPWSRRTWIISQGINIFLLNPHFIHTLFQDSSPLLRGSYLPDRYPTDSNGYLNVGARFPFVVDKPLWKGFQQWQTIAFRWR